jgi:hypothetical protein
VLQVAARSHWKASIGPWMSTVAPCCT